MPEISGIDGSLIRGPLRTQRPPEGSEWDQDPLQDRAESDIDEGNDRHDVAVRPALPNLDVQPLAEEGVGEVQTDGCDANPPTARPRPASMAGQDKGKHKDRQSTRPNSSPYCASSKESHTCKKKPPNTN